MHALRKHGPWFQQSGDQRVWLVYVNVESTLAGFRTFLLEHRSLLRAIVSGVAYVSRAAGVSQVHGVFSRVLAAGVDNGLFRCDDFMWFCRVRRAMEARDFRSMSVADINRFRALRPGFSSARHDDCYQRWLEQQINPLSGSGDEGSKTVDCVLRVHHARHEYGAATPAAQSTRTVDG